MTASFFERIHARVSDVLEALEAVGWELDLAATDPDRAEETESQCASCQARLALAREATEALLLCFPDALRAHETQVRALAAHSGCNSPPPGGSLSCKEDGGAQERPTPGVENSLRHWQQSQRQTGEVILQE